MLKNGMKILFQGDSITDAGRNREDPYGLGCGYPLLVAAQCGMDQPEAPSTFFNRGISGNRTCDLLKRWDEDTLALEPELLSILVGVNNTWRRYDADDPTPVEVFEDEYRQLLTRSKAAGTVHLLLVEPFLLPVKEGQIDWFEDLAPKQKVVWNLAQEFDAIFLPMQLIFNQAAQCCAASHWLSDGVHPTPAGHALIAKHWLKATCDLVACRL